MDSDCTGPVLAKTFRADLFGFLQSTLQVQKLLTRHKAELLAAQQAAAEESRRQLDVLTAEHQVAVRQLKDRLLKVSVGERGCGSQDWHVSVGRRLRTWWLPRQGTEDGVRSMGKKEGLRLLQLTTQK